MHLPIEMLLQVIGKLLCFFSYIHTYICSRVGVTSDAALVSQINAHLLEPSVDGDLSHPVLNMNMFIFLITP